MQPQGIVQEHRGAVTQPIAMLLAQLLNSSAGLQHQIAALHEELVRRENALRDGARDSRWPATASALQPSLYATYLGSFAAYRGADRLDFGRNRAVQELGRYLIARAGRVVTRDELLELLWPDGNVERTGHRLHVAVSGLRQVLDPPGSAASVVHFDDDRYTIESATLVTDCELFELHYRRGRELLAHHPAEAIAAFHDALSLYRDDYLVDHPYADWTHQPRAHFVERRLSALTFLCEQAERAGDLVSVLDYAQQILTIDNLREQAHRCVMRAHHAMGQRACAVQQYTSLVDYLARELGVRPSRQSQQLYHAICTDAELPHPSPYA
jgi:DNA-binding SARP family transcriptional activator